MKCYFHRNDLDGICSGAIVKYKYPECEMIGVDYGDDLVVNSNKLIETLISKETIFIVDFSFDRDMMDYLDGFCDLIWIDHHKTAIEKCEGLEIEGLREVGVAGCELTWSYFYPVEEIPIAIRLLGRYDVWDNNNPHYDWNNEIMPFQYGMRLKNLDTNPWNTWDLLFNSAHPVGFISDIIDHGQICLRYQKQQNEKVLRSNYFEIDFEGHKALCLNSTGFNSQVFEAIWDEEKYDIMLCFAFLGTKWKVSLYSTKDSVDVSEIAKEHGGGGHKGAAGFVIDSIEEIILSKAKEGSNG